MFALRRSWRNASVLYNTRWMSSNSQTPKGCFLLCAFPCVNGAVLIVIVSGIAVLPY